MAAPSLAFGRAHDQEASLVIQAAEVAQRLAVVRDRIASAGGDPERIRVVAVTKGFGPDAVEAAVAAGLGDVGESYAQEMVPKWDALAENARAARVHFVGRLQTNKVRQVAQLVDLWQSVDRARLVREVAKRAPGAAVLVQVDISGEASKGGCAPGQVADLVARAAHAGLDVQGLMGMAAPGDPAGARRSFELLRRLADDLDLEQRSMGMTDDLEAAVREGSTMVRVGTALFGPRPDA